MLNLNWGRVYAIRIGENVFSKWKKKKNKNTQKINENIIYVKFNFTQGKK